MKFSVILLLSFLKFFFGNDIDYDELHNYTLRYQNVRSARRYQSINNKLKQVLYDPDLDCQLRYEFCQRIAENYKYLNKPDSVLYYNKLATNICRDMFYTRKLDYAWYVRTVTGVCFICLFVIIISFKINLELRRSNNEKNSIINILSHDFKTNVRNIYDSVLRLEYNKKSSFFIDTIKEKTSTLHNLSIAIIEWYSMTLRKPIKEEFNILHTIEKFKTDRINIKITGNQIINTNKQIFETVFKILLSNALKFSQKNIDIDIYNVNKSCTISITDYGIGISKRDIQKILEKSIYTRNGIYEETGHGISLLFVHEYLAKIKSKLMITSIIGEFTKVSFTIK